MGQRRVAVHQSGKKVACRRLHLQFNRMHLLFHIEDFLFDQEQFLIDRVFPGYGFVLGEVADGFVLCKGYKSFVRGQFSHNDTKQRGFSGAVYAYDSRLFIVFYMERYVFQYGNFVKGFMDVADG